MKKELQDSVSNLADKCLSENDEYHKYSDDDLMNASIIFVHFFMDMLYTTNQHLTLEEQMDLAETTGKALRELILVSTGKDMHQITKDYGQKK